MDKQKKRWTAFFVAMGIALLAGLVIGSDIFFGIEHGIPSWLITAVSCTVASSIAIFIVSDKPKKE